VGISGLGSCTRSGGATARPAAGTQRLPCIGPLSKRSGAKAQGRGLLSALEPLLERPEATTGCASGDSKAGRGR